MDLSWRSPRDYTRIAGLDPSQAHLHAIAAHLHAIAAPCRGTTPMTPLKELVGSRWSGKSELWLDPLGNAADHSDCTIAIDDDAIHYTWSYQGADHVGSVELSASDSGESGAGFRDSWHSPELLKCEHVAGLPTMLNVAGTYMEEWGWRISLSLRTTTGELVLQMTNVTPWGEEVRAVRMICSRDDG